ncbi:hypothetical protein ACE40V_24540, partial [Salmonella enterica]|uniref:hypothetical protein n=1 Tax=Salmonella enterica TaxID=28901 RepID=UPI003D2A997C
ADETIARMPTKDFYLLQPVSVNTNSIKEHWPYWGLYLSWLVHDLSTHYAICGSEWNASFYGKLNNVTNLVDQTPSIMSVYALAE